MSIEWHFPTESVDILQDMFCEKKNLARNVKNFDIILTSIEYHIQLQLHHNTS